MTNKLVVLILIVTIGLVLAACGSASDDVPSLRDVQDAQPVDAEATDRAPDNEAAMMAFTECLREQGIEVYDPVVDADGNVEKPEFVEGVMPKEKTLELLGRHAPSTSKGSPLGKNAPIWAIRSSGSTSSLPSPSVCATRATMSMNPPQRRLTSGWAASRRSSTGKTLRQ